MTVKSGLKINKKSTKSVSIVSQVTGSKGGFQTVNYPVIMDGDDDDSSGELHIDEGQDYSASNSIAYSRDIRNAYSTNAGAYNNALLGFGGRGDTANSNPLLASRNPSSMVSSGANAKRYANDVPQVGANSRNFHRSASRKSSRHSGSAQSDDYYYPTVGRTTAEQRFSSSVFQSEHNKMAATNLSNSVAMKDMDQSLCQGVKRMLHNHGSRKR